MRGFKSLPSLPIPTDHEALDALADPAVEQQHVPPVLGQLRGQVQILILQLVIEGPDTEILQQPGCKAVF